MQVSEDSEMWQVLPDPSNFRSKYCCELEAKAERDKVDADTDCVSNSEFHASLFSLVRPLLLLSQVIHQVRTLVEYIETVEGIEA